MRSPLTARQRPGQGGPQARPPLGSRRAAALPGRRAKAVEGALAVDGLRRGGLRDAGRRGAYAEPAGGRCPRPAWHLVDDGRWPRWASSVTPQGVVAVCRFLDVPLDEITAAAAAPVAVCADVRDPGNAGTVIRTADAAGADAASCSPAERRPLQRQDRPRDGRQPVPPRRSPSSPTPRPPSAGCRAPAHRARRRRCGRGRPVRRHRATCSRGRTAWLFGNEACGLPDDLAALADHRVAIPIHGRAESLNLATAAAVCLYATARVRG